MLQQPTNQRSMARGDDGSNSTRREFLKQAAAGAVLGAAAPYVLRADNPIELPRAKADSCIFIWLGGGACHLDTWDPKRKSPDGREPGSYYDAIDTALSGVQICQPLARMAPLLDRCILLRSVNHDVIDEHAAATNRLHTGRPPTETTIYPSIGSVVAHELGGRGEGVPPYVVMGYPSASRGPGFLGAGAGYLYLIDTQSGPAGLKPPPGIETPREQRRRELLSVLRKNFSERRGDALAADYVETSRQSIALAGPEFMSVFDLQSEAASLRDDYGSEFGQRCLLARRLVEAGVRFVEVSYNLNFINGTGWDTHNDGQKNQHLLIEDLGQSLATLLLDLEARQRLERTLIVVATEFGRPPEFDGGGGRGHHSRAFSIVLAGGGLKTGQVIGATDELAKEVVERPISVPDLHATIYAALGISPAKELYDGDRPVPITDHGQVIREVFA